MNIPLDCWDQSRALDSVGGDEEFLSELADVFSLACPILLKNLEDSVAAKNSFSHCRYCPTIGTCGREPGRNPGYGSGACCRDDGSAQRPRWHRERLPRATAGGATSSGCAWRFQKRTIWISGDAKTAEDLSCTHLGSASRERFMHIEKPQWL